MNETGTSVVTGGDWRCRCDWCGWPLVDDVMKGCVADNCSMRPTPQLGPIGELHQEIRRLERELDALNTLQREGGEK